MRKIISDLFRWNLIVVVLNSCVIKSDQRDQITFSNSVADIEGRIQRMNTLLPKVPTSEMSNYFFDAEGNLYINNSNIGKPHNNQLDTLSALNGLSSKERREFIDIAIFLKKNEISGCHFERLFETWVYSYKRMDDPSWNNSRDIFLQTAKTPIQDITQAHEILDKERNLVLFKGKL